MTLTAIYTSYYGEKNQIMKREDYPTKKAFKDDLIANGARNIRIHTEADFDAMGRGFRSAAEEKKMRDLEASL